MSKTYLKSDHFVGGGSVRNAGVHNSVAIGLVTGFILGCDVRTIISYRRHRRARQRSRVFWDLVRRTARLAVAPGPVTAAATRTTPRPPSARPQFQPGQRFAACFLLAADSN